MARKKIKINEKTNETIIDPKVVENMIALGLHEYEVAYAHNMTPEAFSRKKTKEINQAIQRGKPRAKDELLQRMMNLTKNKDDLKVQFQALKWMLGVIHHQIEGKTQETEEATKVTIIEETE